MGNFTRLASNEFFPDDISMEHEELLAVLDAEAEQHHTELLEWIAAVRSGEQA